jgi:hypothetical protein
MGNANPEANCEIFWLVVWNMLIIFHIFGIIIIPTDELIFFRGVGQPPTRYAMSTYKKDNPIKNHLKGIALRQTL